MKNKLISMVDEIWNPVKGYEKYYEISNYGNCRSLIRNIEYKSDTKNRKGICCVKKEIKLEKLISLIGFVLIHEPSRQQILNYANFLNTQLKLGYFIPCDSEGNVLEEPISEYEPVNFWNEGVIDEKHNDLIGEYEEAKKRVLFEGFEIFNGNIISCDGTIQVNKEFMNQTIEDLVHYKLTLTASALNILK